jgi:hypothetical protein
MEPRTDESLTQPSIAPRDRPANVFRFTRTSHELPTFS